MERQIFLPQILISAYVTAFNRALITTTENTEHINLYQVNLYVMRRAKGQTKMEIDVIFFDIIYKLKTSVISVV